MNSTYTVVNMKWSCRMDE